MAPVNATLTNLTAPDGRVLLTQRIEGCLEAAIGDGGLSDARMAHWLAALAAPVAGLAAQHREASLPILAIADEEADLVAAQAALERLVQGARTVVFFGTGGSGLGGQMLAQLSGWNIPGAAASRQKARPRTRFFDNLDAATLSGALAGLDLESTRFVIISKSGGTIETLAQAVAALDAVRAAGLGSAIPRLFLGVSDPAVAGTHNCLRALAADQGFAVLEHPPGIGGRFSALSIVGLLPLMVRGQDARAVRAGARCVLDTLARHPEPATFAPAVGAAVAVGLARDRGIRVNVMLPYADRLARFAAWYVQLWAESLGKAGQGTTPVACLGPLDQHSQLQLFMDGPREHFITVVRPPTLGAGPRLPADLAAAAGLDILAGRAIGDLVAAQSHAVPQALVEAGRPVRTIDLDRLDEAAVGALMMHMMLETILAADLFRVDAFDQPAVELAKTLTRSRLAR